jgi:transcriptional regulator with XRE-family HTH domain
MPGRRSNRSNSAKSPVAVAIGKVLREKREALEVSQEQFAERVSLSKNYIGNIERGEYEVAISTLDQIAKALEIKASEIIRDAGF